MPTVKKAENALTRKVGPLPAWAWAVTGGAALYWYRNRQSSSANPNVPSSPPASVNPDTGLPWNIDPNTGLPYGTGDGSSSSPGPGPDSSPGTDPGGPASPGPAGTNPAPPKKKHKPKRKRPRLRLRRRRKPQSPAHGKHRAHPPHRPPKPKRRHLIPGRKAQRDRASVTHGADTGGHGRARGRQPRFGVPVTMAAHHPASSSRSEAATMPQGGRAHAGEHGPGPSNFKPRSSAPPAQGRVERAHVAAGAKAPAVPRREAGHQAAKKAPPQHKSSRRRK